MSVCDDESVWLHHPLLLGSEADLNDIVGAVEKIQANCDELAGIPRPVHKARFQPAASRTEARGFHGKRPPHQRAVCRGVRRLESSSPRLTCRLAGLIFLAPDIAVRR